MSKLSKQNTGHLSGAKCQQNSTKHQNNQEVDMVRIYNFTGTELKINLD